MAPLDAPSSTPVSDNSQYGADNVLSYASEAENLFISQNGCIMGFVTTQQLLHTFPCVINLHDVGIYGKIRKVISSWVHQQEQTLSLRITDAVRDGLQGEAMEDLS